MAKKTLKATHRPLGLSKGQLNTERKNGNIPAVIFGKDIDSTPIFVDYQSFKNTYSQSGKIFELTFEGKKHLVNTKFINRDPLQKTIYQIDFHKLTKGEETTVYVPIELENNEDLSIDYQGAITLIRDKVLVKATPKNIPEKIMINMSKIKEGESFHIKDLKKNKKFSIEEDQDLTLATYVSSRGQKSELEVEPAGLDPTLTPATNEEATQSL